MCVLVSSQRRASSLFVSGRPGHLGPRQLMLLLLLELHRIRGTFGYGLTVRASSFSEDGASASSAGETDGRNSSQHDESVVLAHVNQQLHGGGVVVERECPTDNCDMITDPLLLVTSKSNFYPLRLCNPPRRIPMLRGLPFDGAKDVVSSTGRLVCSSNRKAGSSSGTAQQEDEGPETSESDEVESDTDFSSMEQQHDAANGAHQIQRPRHGRPRSALPLLFGGSARRLNDALEQLRHEDEEDHQDQAEVASSSDVENEKENEHEMKMNQNHREGGLQDEETAEVVVERGKVEHDVVVVVPEEAVPVAEHQADEINVNLNPQQDDNSSQKNFYALNTLPDQIFAEWIWRPNFVDFKNSLGVVDRARADAFTREGKLRRKRLLCQLARFYGDDSSSLCRWCSMMTQSFSEFLQDEPDGHDVAFVDAASSGDHEANLRPPLSNHDAAHHQERTSNSNGQRPAPAAGTSPTINSSSNFGEDPARSCARRKNRMRMPTTVFYHDYPELRVRNRRRRGEPEQSRSNAAAASAASSSSNVVSPTTRTRLDSFQDESSNETTWTTEEENITRQEPGYVEDARAMQQAILSRLPMRRSRSSIVENAFRQYRQRYEERNRATPTEEEEENHESETNFHRKNSNKRRRPATSSEVDHDDDSGRPASSASSQEDVEATETPLTVLDFVFLLRLIGVSRDGISRMKQLLFEIVEEKQPGEVAFVKAAKKPCNALLSPSGARAAAYGAGRRLAHEEDFSGGTQNEDRTGRATSESLRDAGTNSRIFLDGCEIHEDESRGCIFRVSGRWNYELKLFRHPPKPKEDNVRTVMAYLPEKVEGDCVWDRVLASKVVMDL
ncbi:unnamed protein product [Amoebophrya sp. A120]|nr:unnamed protein product [Amoebophrya sp. A120]|eukprot:GSA120T00018312001.1